MFRIPSPAALVGTILLSTCCHVSASAPVPFRNTELTIDARADDLISQLTLEEKIGLLWELAPAIDRLGIDKYYHGNEALHGVVRPGKFTVFPQAIAFGATFNPDLIHQVATAISDEARGRWNELEQGKKQTQYHSDLLTFWSPNINMARDPRWGRTAGTYGEDPQLTSEIGVAFVKGLQGDHPTYLKVVATPKHYVANNVEENRFGANSVISERTLREYYLPAFKATIMEGQAQSIMSAYNAVNYVPSNANRWLLKDILRGEWGFKGYVVSDCGAPAFLVNDHKFAPTKADAAAISIKSGMDLECNGGGRVIADHLKTAYEQGKVTLEEIDDAVRNVLTARFKLGLFDPADNNPYTQISPDVVGSPEHQKLALETALQSMVLLKNDNNLLPLDIDQLNSIAVIGHNANKVVFGDYSGESLNEAVTPLMGLKQRLGDQVAINFVDSVLQVGNFTKIDGKFFTTETGEAGLRAEYFVGKSLSGTPSIRIDKTVDLHSTENPPDPFLKPGQKSVRWTGFITGPETAEYHVGTKSDDGARLWIDDQLVVDDWRDHGETLTFSTFRFEKGRQYRIKAEWYDGGGDASMRLMWEPKHGAVNKFEPEVAAAKASDVVIAVIGTDTKSEREGMDKIDLDLPGNQLDMLKAVHKANKNMIVVLVTGSQHTMGWIKDNVPAVLNAWYPGEQGGNAIAQIMMGDYNPAGRTPLTYYESVDALPAMERYEISEGRTYQYYSGKPLWEFGYGLSYSQFEYAQPKLVPVTKNGVMTFHVSVDITNTSKRDGDEVAQLYASFPDSKVVRPIRQLKGFKRVHVKTGETQSVSFEVPRDELAYWSTKQQGWRVEPSRVLFELGASSKDIRKQVSAEVGLQ